MFRGFQPHAVLVAGLLSFAVASGVKADEPALVLGFRSVDALLDDADYVGGKVGQANAKQNVEGLIGAFTGGKGLAGLDRTKPFGVYQQIVDQTSSAGPVVFLPVSDEDDFVSLLKTFAPDMSESDGVWSMTLNGRPAYAKISNGYFFASPMEESLSDLVDPADIISDDYDVALDINISTIPQELKDVFLSSAQMQGRANLENGPEPANEAERAGREFGFEQSINLMKAMVNDGDQITFGINIDSETGLGTVDLGFSSKEGSGLASAMQAYAEIVPMYAAVVSEDAPLALVVSHPTTGLLEHLDGIFEQIQNTAEKDIAGNAELKTEEAREAARGYAKRLLAIARTTAESGALHSVMVLAKGDDDTLQFVAGTHVDDAEKAQSLLEDSIADQSAAGQDAKVSLDVEKYEGARIHAIEMGSEAPQAQMFGDEDGHLAVAEDSLWMAMGGGNLTALKAALDAATEDPAEDESPIFLAARPATLVLLMEKNDKALLARAKAIAGTDGDVLNIEIAPDETGATLHIEFGIDLLKLAPK